MELNKIFSKVSEELSYTFKSNEASSGKIGFVESDNFGYILANGKQYGGSYSYINSMISDAILAEYKTVTAVEDNILKFPDDTEDMTIASNSVAITRVYFHDIDVENITGIKVEIMPTTKGTTTGLETEPLYLLLWETDSTGSNNTLIGTSSNTINAVTDTNHLWYFDGVTLESAKYYFVTFSTTESWTSAGEKTVYVLAKSLSSGKVYISNKSYIQQNMTPRVKIYYSAKEDPTLLNILNDKADVNHTHTFSDIIDTTFVYSDETTVDYYSGKSTGRAVWYRANMPAITGYMSTVTVKASTDGTSTNYQVPLYAILHSGTTIYGVSKNTWKFETGVSCEFTFDSIYINGEYSISFSRTDEIESIPVKTDNSAAATDGLTVDTESAGTQNWTPNIIITYAGSSTATTQSISSVLDDINQSLASKEDVANKVTAISSASTDDQYPSAKAVYSVMDAVRDEVVNAIDNFAYVEWLDNKVTTISSASTDDQYPSAKLVYTSLAGKEDVANKVTTISSASTDDQYPSAKLVYTALDGKEDVVNKVTYVSSSSTDTEYPTAKLLYEGLQPENLWAEYVPKS